MKKRAEPTIVLSVRMDSKLKYLAELAARKQRQSFPDFVRWALKRYLKELQGLEK